MTQLFHISLPIKPIALKRHRTRFGRTYDPQSVLKKKLAHLITTQIPFGTPTPFNQPLSVFFNFEFAMPKSWSKKKRSQYLLEPHTQRIDLSNLIKYLEDTLNNVIWKDDAIIWHIRAEKIWAEKDSIEIKVFG